MLVLVISLSLGTREMLNLSTARDMIPSPENETCEETSKQMKERVNQIAPAWNCVREKQRTTGGGARESDEGSGQGYYDADEQRMRKCDER